MTGESVVADVDFSVASWAIRAPVVGYTHTCRTGKQRAMRWRMAEYGEAARFCPGEMHVDCRKTATAALGALVSRLPDTAVTRVLVPSLAELASAWILRMPVRRVVERQAGARVAAMPSAEDT